MNRATVDYGIDLGTTNSEVALFNGTAPEIIKNNEGAEITPSAVWMDKNGRLHVGKLAKQRLEDDPDNAFCEFKLQMGSPTEYTFARTGRTMKPEDLSAEVLKSLKGDVQRLRGEELGAAVITVPAAFELPQCDATNKAARLAGFQFSPLVQEPVAAAMAYGFDSQSENVFWLVYDFGGGTFDAAVVQVRDGVIQVVNHGGDKHLGGKLLDWEIVEQLLIPAVQKQAPVGELRRGNPKCRAAIAKLKLLAEEAKIRVSAEDSAEIIIDNLCIDDRGEPVRFEYELRRADVERLAEPFVLRSINVVRQVLAEQRLEPEHVERVLLVGGPTMMPYLRQRLADRKDGLGIPLEFGVDPLTVVARGAAVFARTQRTEAQPVVAAAGQYAVQLEYKPAGPDPEPLVGGMVVAPQATNLAGHSIEFVNVTVQPPWRSGRIGLSPDGGFITNLWAQKGPENKFLVELRNAAGTKVPTVPDHFTYVIMVVSTDQPLIHSMGIGLANNEMEFYFNKGEALPVRHREVLLTATQLRRGQIDDIVRVPVMEGQKRRADRNHHIGSLEIKGSEVNRDVAPGSEIEVTLEIDRSRLIRVKAYVPVLDEEFENMLKLGGEQPDREHLQKDFDREKARLEKLRRQVKETRDAEAEKALFRIDGERMLHDVEVSLGAMTGDRDAGQKCQDRLLDLKGALDEVEDKLAWPALVAAAGKEVEVERKIVNDANFKATREEKEQFATLEREIRAAIGERDPDLLHRKVQELDRLGAIIVLRHPAWWVAQLERFEKGQRKVTDAVRAADYVAQGRRAINNNDPNGLKAAVRQLFTLLPADDTDRQRFSGVMRSA